MLISNIPRCIHKVLCNVMNIFKDMFKADDVLDLYKDHNTQFVLINKPDEQTTCIYDIRLKFVATFKNLTLNLFAMVMKGNDCG